MIGFWNCHRVWLLLPLGSKSTTYWGDAISGTCVHIIRIIPRNERDDSWIEWLIYFLQWHEQCYWWRAASPRGYPVLQGSSLAVVETRRKPLLVISARPDVLFLPQSLELATHLDQANACDGNYCLYWLGLQFLCQQVCQFVSNF